jgi:hypothetical protein
VTEILRLETRIDVSNGVFVRFHASDFCAGDNRLLKSTSTRISDVFTSRVSSTPLF